MTIHEFDEFRWTFSSISHVCSNSYRTTICRNHTPVPSWSDLNLIDLGWRGSDIAVIHM